MKIIIALLVGFVVAQPFKLAGQENTVKDGPVKIYYPSGRLSSEGFMRNGNPDGYWKTYFPSGVLKSEGNRRNHLLDSVWVFYNEAGDTLQKVNYVMGKRNGYLYEYNVQAKNEPLSRGRIIARELYVNDKKEGKAFYYYPNGRIKEEVMFSGSKRNGASVEFDENGNVITIQRFKNGLLVEREKINRVDESGLKQGVWKTFYENGRVKSEANYRNNILNGIYKEYDEGGMVKVVFQYANGSIVEESDTTELDIEVKNEFDSNGNLVYSGSYRKNIPVGIHRVYDGKGNVINGFLFSGNGEKLGEGIISPEGKKEGGWKYYYNDGSIRSAGNYNGNLESGPWKYYTRDGRIEQTGVYKNGKFDGLWSWYYPNGNVKREEEYYDGREEGLSVEYDSVGEIIVKGSYYDGAKEGEWIYKAGDYSEKGKYIGDLKDGKWQAFYSNGRLKYEGNYIQGNPDGEHLFYYENGQIKEINNYIMGIAEKNWKKYDENGILIITITYRDNREYRINGEKVEFAESDVRLIQ